MITSLEQLYNRHHTAFRLNLVAGTLNGQHIVDWIYMVEDETIIPYVQGSALIVTSAARNRRDPEWLLHLLKDLIEVRASGLIVNTGKYIHEIPEEAIRLCNEHHFPLLTMPWEIRITEMTQTLCKTIIDNQQEILLHDRAICDAILHPEAPEEYRERLAAFYDLRGDFTVFCVHATDRLNSSESSIFLLPRDMSYRLERRIRALRPASNPDMHICWVQCDWYQLIVVSHMAPGVAEQIPRIIREVYEPIRETHRVHVGIGTTEMGVAGLSESYQCALTALRLAEFRDTFAMSFKEMGFFRILLSCRRESIVRDYANDLLAPIDAMGNKAEDYLTLLDAYIRHDRSLERTAEELFLHRNTVNYRLNKLRDVLGSPLKTAEDLMPYLIALYIRRPNRKNS